MSERDAILFANAAFYAAFAARDLDAMDKAWAKNRPVSCAHPGWQPLIGREAVMGSWRAILGNPGSPKISCGGEQVTLHGETAIVICIEQIKESSGPPQYFTATNIYIKTGPLWTMVHHQAGPVKVDPKLFKEEERTPLN